MLPHEQQFRKGHLQKTILISFILSLSSFSYSCADVDPCNGHYRLDDSISSHDRAILEIAREDDNRFVGHEALVFDEHARCPIFFADLGDYDEDTGGGMILGHHYFGESIGINNKEIQSYDPDHYDSLLHVVAEHEMMHGLGLKHTHGDGKSTKQVNGIMHPTANWYDSFNNIDFEECERVGACVD